MIAQSDQLYNSSTSARKQLVLKQSYVEALQTWKSCINMSYCDIPQFQGGVKGHTFYYFVLLFVLHSASHSYWYANQFMLHKWLQSIILTLNINAFGNSVGLIIFII